MLGNARANPGPEPASEAQEDRSKFLDVVCFGTLASLRIGRIDQYPRVDTGTEVLTVVPSVAADAAIVSLTLSALGARVGLICNDLGDDSDGRELLDRVRRRGVVTTAALRSEARTPFALTVVDRTGRSTFFCYLSDSAERLLAADLDLVSAASLLYVDAYPQTQRALVRAIARAGELGVPVFLNLSDYVPDAELDRLLRQGVSIIQRSASGQSVQRAREVCEATADRYGASLSVMTMGSRGVIYTNRAGTFRLRAHTVPVVNTCGAGSTFSGGLAFGRVRSWPDDEVVSFANALAGLYCSVPNGLGSLSATDVSEFQASRSLRPRRLGRR